MQKATSRAQVASVIHYFEDCDGTRPICAQIVQTCMYLARIGRPDLLWPFNKLARSVTKWNEDCVKKLARSTSYINQTKIQDSTGFVGDTNSRLQNLDLFRTLLLLKTWKIPNQLKPRYLCSYFLDVQATNSRVPHECRIRRSSFGRWVETARCMQFWDCVLETFSRSSTKGKLKSQSSERHSHFHSVDHVSYEMTDHVPSYIPDSSFPARTYIFKDNETVIPLASR